MPNSPLIVAHRLAMSYDGVAQNLRDIDLQINSGQFVSIVGPSGCGKSTLLRLIAGLREPSDGELRVDGSVPAGSTKRMAFVFQDPNLLPWRTVAGNVRLPFELDADAGPSSLSSSANRSVDQQIADAIQLVGLSASDSTKRTRQLSGGMRMRVSLARALVTQPDVLLLDEPFAALDDILRQQLNDELQRIWWDRRCTAVFVTHNVSEAVFLSERVLVMSRSPGTLIDEITVPFPYPRQPDLRATAEFASLTGKVSTALRTAVEQSVIGHG